MDITNELIRQKCESEELKLEQSSNSKIECVSHIKRFLEICVADPEFREKVSTEPREAVARYGLKVDPEEIKPLWDVRFSEELGQELPMSPSLKLWYEFVAETQTHKLMKSIANSSNESHFKAWRKRQIARTTSQFKKIFEDGLLHAPVCFELTKGCSVGCWFCGISAPRLSDTFIYNQENAKLWHDALKLIKELLGPAAGAGFCYWATDPFDNPDYENFCNDFHKVFGIFPPTTTAQPLKDPVRTRSFLKLSREKGCLQNRFSILSLNMLNQVYEEFTPEELAFVSLAILNKESDTMKANAGRARERNIKTEEKESKFLTQGTIACVTGFLFNMVDRSVKLISPCNANDRWPLGYIVYDEGTFSNLNELKTLLERMINDNMSSRVRPSDLMSFRPDLKYEGFSDGFQVSTTFKTFTFRHSSYLKELGDVVYKGGKTAEEIASIFDAYGVSSSQIFHYLNLMLEKGVLDDEPKPTAIE